MVGNHLHQAAINNVEGRQHDIFANRMAGNITDEGQAIKNSEAEFERDITWESCIALFTMCIGPIQWRQYPAHIVK